MRFDREINLTFTSDPGHGWLRVPATWLIRLGIADDISPYSYLDSEGNYAYLEEDCDAGHIIKALENEGATLTFSSKFTNNRSRIRNLYCYRSGDINHPSNKQG